MISWIYRSPIQTTNYQLLVKRDDLQANTLDIDGQDKMTTRVASARKVFRMQLWDLIFRNAVGFWRRKMLIARLLY